MADENILKKPWRFHSLLAGGVLGVGMVITHFFTAQAMVLGAINVKLLESHVTYICVESVLI